MPELPEVERARRLIEAEGAGRQITAVATVDDERVYRDAPPDEVRRALEGRTLVAAHRRGKYLWLDLSGEGPLPLFHLGMSGGWASPTQPELALKSGTTPSAAWPPRFWKIELVLTGERRLAMTNARRLGRIVLRHRPLEEAPVGELGFDPLHRFPTATTLAPLLARKRRPIKAVLLDQGLFAGVGNWIADETLYQARLDPRRGADSLSAVEIRALRRALLRVVETAVAADADSERFPRGWLFHRRWGRRVGVKTHHGEAIAFIEVGGRTTAWVPERQG